MTTKLINTVLLIATVIGVVFAYRAGNRHRELLAEQSQLQAEFGQMPITDPSNVYVLALETGEGLHFAWRVHVPAGWTGWETRGIFGPNSRSDSSTEATQFVVHVRIRENDRGVLEVFTKHKHGGDQQALVGPDLAPISLEQFRDLQVLQFASDGYSEVGANEVVTLLRLELPDEARQKAEQSVDQAVRRRARNPLFELRFGSPNALERLRRQEGQDDL